LVGCPPRLSLDFLLLILSLWAKEQHESGETMTAIRANVSGANGWSANQSVGTLVDGLMLLP